MDNKMRWLGLALVGLVAVGSSNMVSSLRAQAGAQPGLGGRVSSAEEGPMEGVLVSAQRAGSTISVTVVTDRQGQFRFASTTEPGAYTLRVRAIGYELEGPQKVTVEAGRAATADVRLKKTQNLAAQLTNTEWMMSVPGTKEEKATLKPCAHCHTLELLTRSRHNSEQFVGVLQRMATYPQLAFPPKIQKLPAPRVGAGVISPEDRLAGYRKHAQYLATINRSSGPQWTYELKTLPRPSGDATRVVYTEYDLPARTNQPHDVIVDSQGTIWYASFGEQILAKVDPATGKVTEYPIPVLKPEAPTGVLGVRFDRDENIWMGMQFQGGIAKFDRKTETFQTWSLPPEHNGPHVQVNQVSPERSYIDGKVWLQDAGTYRVFRLDLASNKFEVFEPYKIPRPNVYDVIPDSKNNGFFLVYGAADIGRIDAKTGEMAIFKTPTPGSGPRRGMMDAEDRLWFGENHGDKIGMFDTRTNQFKEWTPTTPGTYPYDATIDKDGYVWSGGEFSDLIIRLDPRTGRSVEYLMPEQTNLRRVFVDNRTSPPTFWVGSNHGASIFKLQPLP